MEGVLHIRCILPCLVVVCWLESQSVEVSVGASGKGAEVEMLSLIIFCKKILLFEMFGIAARCQV